MMGRVQAGAGAARAVGGRVVATGQRQAGGQILGGEIVPVDADGKALRGHTNLLRGRVKPWREREIAPGVGTVASPRRTKPPERPEPEREAVTTAVSNQEIMRA